MPKFLIVEGLIGAGKTTFIPHLVDFFAQRSIHTIYIKEPVDLWKQKDESGTSPLERFYSNPEKYAFEFHCFVLKTIFENTQKQIATIKSNNTIIISERSIFSVKHFFIPNLKQFLTPTQLTTFDDMFEDYKKQLPNPDLFVWLDTPIDECMKRVSMRNRENESSSISREYQLNLREYHKTFFYNNSSSRVVIVDQPNLDYKNYYNIILQNGFASEEFKTLAWIYGCI